MIKRILKVRVLQFYQILLELGLLRILFLLGLFTVGGLYLFNNISKAQNLEIITGFFVLSTLLIHLTRKDKTFLYINSLRPYQIFLVEYLLICTPLIVLLLYHAIWLYAGINIGLVFLISLLKVNLKISHANTMFQNLIPDSVFEWKSGIRPYLYAFIFLWFLAFATSFYLISVPVILLILSVSILNFYDEAEPLEILLAKSLNTKAFLLKKISVHVRVYFYFSLPLVFMFLLFNYEYYYIILFEWVMLIILLVYSILLKYAYYKPNKKSGATKIYTNIGALSIFIPILLPLIIILMLKFIYQAKLNLNFYLDDFN